MMRKDRYLYLTLIGLFSLQSCGDQVVSDTAEGGVVETELQSEVIVENEILPNDTSKKVLNPSEQIPIDYTIYERIGGDLNNDGIADSVFVIKKIDEKNIVTNTFDEVVDRNRRGIMVFLHQNEQWDLSVKNMDCFSSENEDGGVYYPPQLAVVIKNGKLYFEYEHGRYGYWSYTFRFKSSDFELIGYDWTDTFGPIIQSETSINFLTKRKLFRENINQDAEDANEEIFEETWSDIEVVELMKLSEIDDFDELVVNEYEK